jgi:hypothetical protein
LYRNIIIKKQNLLCRTLTFPFGNTGTIWMWQKGERYLCTWIQRRLYCIPEHILYNMHNPWRAAHSMPSFEHKTICAIGPSRGNVTVDVSRQITSILANLFRSVSESRFTIVCNVHPDIFIMFSRRVIWTKILTKILNTILFRRRPALRCKCECV